jgi:hypothetical protein
VLYKRRGRARRIAWSGLAVNDTDVAALEDADYHQEAPTVCASRSSTARCFPTGPVFLEMFTA